MSHSEFEEKAKERRKAIYNCSMAMLETIRSYGFAATLDLVIRISNYDSIVSELLPYFPRLASVAMLEASNIRRSSKMVVDNSGEPITESELRSVEAGQGITK